MAGADRARNRMVARLLASGRLRTRAVEDAMRAVPRHLFLPGLPLDEAYADEAVAVQHVEGVATSSASQPSMMAIMLEQLALQPGHRVLEIGAGTGYNAALMARIVGPTGTVTSVDIDADLVASAARHLTAAGATGVELVHGDGALGHPPGAPYDRIVLTVGSADVRAEWVDQLAPGGRLLLPLALRGSQLSVALDLGGDGLLRSASVRSCAFIRLRGIGAGPETLLPLPGHGALHLPEDADAAPDPVVVAAALEAPGPVLGSPVAVGPRDVWDGFGLWLALAEPRAARLGTTDADGVLAGAAFSLGGASAAVALVGPGPGLALVGPPEPGASHPTAVRVFGPDGAAAAERLLIALAAWDTAGRPEAADLDLLVAPRPRPLEPAPGTSLVLLPSASVLASWPAVPARAV